jgi:hypothetical protein
MDAQKAISSGAREGMVQDQSAHVFVSYRRDDVPDATDRLAASLVERFGNDHVFLDIDSVEIGAPFASVIGDWVARCDVLLVVMGRNWLGATDSDGGRRLDDPQDYVRLEIEAGLKRDIRVVPVLIHGVGLPRAESLPKTLISLIERNAAELSRAYWDLDVTKLLSAIERVAAGQRRRAQHSAQHLMPQSAEEVFARVPAEPVEVTSSTGPSKRRQLPIGRLLLNKLQNGGRAWRGRAYAIRQRIKLATVHLERVGTDLNATLLRSKRLRLRARVTTVVLGCTIAVAVAVLLVFNGPRGLQTLRSGVVTLSFVDPWHRTEHATETGLKLFSRPLTLLDGGSTLSAGEISVPNLIPGGIPQALTSGLGSSSEQSTVSVATYPARRYRWTVRNGIESLLLVLVSQSKDIGVLCQGPVASAKACEVTANRIKVSVDIESPGPNATLATTLKDCLAPISRAIASQVDLRSRGLSVRARTAQRIADAEGAGARRLSSAEAGVGERNRSAVRSLKIALEREAALWAALAVAARDGHSQAYMGARIQLEGHQEVPAAVKDLSSQGFELPPFSAVKVPPMPSEPARESAAAAGTPSAQPQVSTSSAVSEGTNRSTGSTKTKAGSRSQPFRSLEGTAK